MADELNPQEAIAEEALSPSEDVEPESFPAAAGDGVPEPEAVPESIETAEPEVTDGDPAAEVETEAPVEAAGAGEESEPANVDDDAAAAAAAAEIPAEGEPAEGDEEGGEPAKAVEGEEAAPPEGAEPAGEAVEIAADDTNVSEAVEADADTAAPVEGAVESEEKDVSVVETETTPLLEDAPMQVDSLQEEQGAIQQDEDEESIDLFAAEELLIMPQYNREELLQKYQAAVTEREQLSARNSAVQHKLAEFFRKKKTEEARHDVDKNVADQEQRYVKYMSNLEELRKQLVEEQTTYKEHLDELKERKVDKQAKVEEEWKKSSEFKKAVATASINSRSGRPIPAKDIEQYEINERKKEAEVSQVRLENIKLKNKLNKQEMQLKQKEELAEGLHLIDFEQLKIENQTYNEKIEERNEELLKLRKKITNTVQVLTHLKEKLQFVQAENQVKKQKLLVVEQDVARKRDVLSRTKQARDALRHDNSKLQQKCGLLGNTDLLRDFENTTDEGDDLRHRLEQLKRLHAELTLNLNGVKKKIELAKENQP